MLVTPDPLANTGRYPMSAASSLPHGDCGKSCPVCGGAMELEAIGSTHHWQCCSCPRCEPASAQELGTLRRYAQSWDRRAGVLRRRTAQ
jgi:hypothetical protein